MPWTHAEHYSPRRERLIVGVLVLWLGLGVVAGWVVAQRLPDLPEASEATSLPPLIERLELDSGNDIVLWNQIVEHPDALHWADTRTDEDSFRDRLVALRIYRQVAVQNPLSLSQSQIERIVHFAESFDVPLRTFAGETLLLLGDKRGIDPLIDALDIKSALRYTMPPQTADRFAERVLEHHFGRLPAHIEGETAYDRWLEVKPLLRFLP